MKINAESKFELGEIVYLCTQKERQETETCRGCDGKKTLRFHTGTLAKCSMCSGYGWEFRGRMLKRWIKGVAGKIQSIHVSVVGRKVAVRYNVLFGENESKLSCGEADLARHADVNKMLDAKNDRLRAKDQFLEEAPAEA